MRKCGGFIGANVADNWNVIAQLRLRHGIPTGRREDDAIHLFTTERTYDAIGQGELQALGLDHNIVVEAMVEKAFALCKLTDSHSGCCSREGGPAGQTVPN
jgi:hypothetical protein